MQQLWAVSLVKFDRDTFETPISTLVGTDKNKAIKQQLEMAENMKTSYTFPKNVRVLVAEFKQVAIKTDFELRDCQGIPAIAPITERNGLC